MKKLIGLVLGLVFLTSCEKEDILPVQSQNTPTVAVVFDPFAALPKETSIPDSSFEKVLIEKGLDAILDGKVTTSNVSLLTEFKVLEPKGIQSLKGIESFISLTRLQIEHQKIKEVDVTKNINLTLLSLWDNPISTIDVTRNSKLTVLGLSDTHISTIDLSKNVALEEIDFQNSGGKGYGINKGFTSLDLTHNVNLKRVYVWQNRITELDVTMCPKLTDLWIYDNPQLKSLKLIPNQNLKMMIAWNTGLETLDLKGSYPLSINVENSEVLKTVRVSSLQWINAQITRNAAAYTKDQHTQWIE